ncbi:MAG: zf-HC2 domain-containing protein [Planctomycetes bacterium]|nr:zf-HC2 domain-containing protein [Planctomycetota bacterium]
MLSCKEAIKLASQNLDRELSFWQRVGLRFHVAMCAACSAYKRQVEALDRLISQRDRSDTPPPGDERLSEDRIVQIRAALRSEEKSSLPSNENQV